MLEESVTYQAEFNDLESADNYLVSTMDRLEADGWFIHQYHVTSTYQNTWSVTIHVGRNEPGQEDLD